MVETLTQTPDYAKAAQRGFEAWRETTDRTLGGWWELNQRFQSAQLELLTGALRRLGEVPTLLMGGAAHQLRFAAALQTPATESSIVELRNELTELTRRVEESAGQTHEQLGSLQPIEQQVTELAALNGFLPTRLTAIEGQVAALGQLGARITALQEQLQHANLGQIGEVSARIDQLDLAGLRRDLDERLSRLESAVSSAQSSAQVTEQPASPDAAPATSKAPSRSTKGGNGKTTTSLPQVEA